MALQIAVIGSGADAEAAAEEVGRLLAERGATVVTGGLGEVMAAASRARRPPADGRSGSSRATERDAANEWVDVAVATGIGHARNLAVVASADAAIAVGGSWGTLAEIAYARALGRPVVILDPGWKLEGDGIVHAASPAEAVEFALASVID